MGNEETGVQVTLKDIWIEVRRLQDVVSAMTPQAQQLGDHESRLRSLERWKYALPTSLFIAGGSIITDIILISVKK